MARAPGSFRLNWGIILRSFLPGFLLAMCLVAPASRAEEVDVIWRHRASMGNVTITANPLGMASRISFYAARGFTPGTIDSYARSCGLSFGMQNIGSESITTRLADWFAIGADDREVRFRLPEVWDADWDKAGVAQAARIAFRWAQFQSESRFEPGDWIMGMTTLQEVPIPPFRLVVRYRDYKGNHEIVLDSLTCAPD